MPFPLFWAAALLLEGNEQIEGQARERNLLDAESERLARIDRLDSGFQNLQVSNQFDTNQVARFQSRFENSQALQRSRNPNERKLGLSMMDGLNREFNAFEQQNENEFRADQIRAEEREIVLAGQGKADNEKRLDRTIKMRAQLDKALQPLTRVTRAYNKVISLLDVGDRVASRSAQTIFIQALDNSVVRESESRSFSANNGLLNQIKDIFNRTEGKDMTEIDKQALRNASAAIVNQERVTAQGIVESFRLRATSNALDPDKVTIGVDKNLFTRVTINKEAQIRAQEQADQLEKELVGQRLVAAPTEGLQLGRGIGIIGRAGAEVFQDVSREVRGVKPMLDPVTGDLFEVDAKGKITKFRESNRKVDSQGREMAFFDSGDGDGAKWHFIDSNQRQAAEQQRRAREPQGSIFTPGSAAAERFKREVRSR